MAFVAWSDSAWSVRTDGSSQGGYVVAATEASFLDGKENLCSPISFSSARLRRLARSSSAAEIQGANNAQEELEYLHLAWAELTQGALT